MRLAKAALAALLVLPAVAGPAPKLLVVISVDQLSAELIQRWGPELPGGLGRLYREGCNFLAAYHDHGVTETGPGHAVLLTGRHPRHTGIVANQWRDPETGRFSYCVADPGHTVLGLAPGGAGASARHLAGTTLGGWLHQQRPGSRIFAVTGKDRSAILMAGPQAEGVYWFAGPAGFTSSTAYTHELPPWLRAYDQRFLAGLAPADLVWTALDPGQPPATASYSIAGRTLTMGLPRTVGAGALDEGFWERFCTSPFLDQAILGAAQALVEGERLGAGPGLDVLALGLSGTDYVGHAFGNSGPEMADQLRRLDRSLGQFLAPLLARPGTWVVLSADHGAADFPERRNRQGLPGQRLDPKDWQARLESRLAHSLGGARAYFRPLASCQLSLDPEALAASGHSRAEILAAARRECLASPEVEAAFTGEELEQLTPTAVGPDRTSLAERMRLSYLRGRSGDLVVVFRPFTTLGGGVAGHGSPYDYDRRVPLIFWGPWKPARHGEPVSVVDLAPTLARQLGIEPGPGVDGRALELELD